MLLPGILLLVDIKGGFVCFLGFSFKPKNRTQQQHMHLHFTSNILQAHETGLCSFLLLHSFPQGSSMQQGMFLCLHSWGEEESLRARHKTVLFTKIVSFCFLLCDVKGLWPTKYQKNTTTKAHFTLRVKANNVQLKSSISYWCKSWDQPHGLLH